MEDWDSICHYFATPEFKKMSARNKANRAKQNTPHVAGTKSFARLQQEEKATTGSEPGQIKLYKMTRFSRKKNAWVTKDAEENHEKMENLQKNVLSRGSRLDNRGGNMFASPWTGTWLHTWSWSWSKTSSSSYNKQVKADWEDYERRAEQEDSEIKQQNSEIKQQNMVIQQQNTEMQLEMQEMKASHKRTDEMLQALMAQLQTGGDMGFMRLSIWFI